MRQNVPFARTLVCGLLTTTALASPAWAQPTEADIPPVYRSVDENSVDQISGQLVRSMVSIGIGPGGPGSLSYEWGTSNSAQNESIGFVNPNSPTTGKYSVTLAGATETFTLSGTLGSGTFTSDLGTASTLTYSTATSTYTYTLGDGTVAQFPSYGGRAHIQTLTSPSGQSLTYYYESMAAVPPYTYTYYYVRSVVSNLGYQLHYDYVPSGPGYRMSRVVLFNRAVESCDPNADPCTLTGNWPSLTFTTPAGETDATDNLGRVYRWTTVPVGTAGTTVMYYPSGRTFSYTLNSNWQVTSYSDGRGTWQYQRPNPFGGTTLTYYPEANGPPRQVIFDPSSGHILQDYTHQLQTVYTWTSNRITSVAVTGGPTTQYTYDARGNVTQVRRISSTPGTPADVITSAVYPTTCANPRTCNQPTSTTDARGFTTDYTYDPTHGGVLTAMRPVAPNGIRPQIAYSYAPYQAYYRDATGAISASGSTVYLRTMTSACMTGTPGSCSGTADETRTTISYGPQTPGTANNLLPASTTSGDGTGALAATTTTTYTADGDVETVDDPLASGDHTMRNYYDAARRRIGTISADPDGPSGNPRLASRTAYNDDDQPTTEEMGTATDQSASGMSTFTSLRQQVTAYDAQGRATSVRLSAGGTTYALNQASTTASGFPDCSAVRMNPATFASPPASACTPAAAGSDGPDRITQISYDWYRRLATTITTGIGVSPAIDSANTFNSLNQVATATDGNGNLTTYEYDGFGRRVKTRYPSPTTTGQSSTTDYEQMTYDAAGNVTALRLRSGASIGLTYDHLNRMSLKDLPGSDPDVSYAYDNLDRTTSALFTATGLGVTNSYDAMSRMTSTSSVISGTPRTLSYQYDLAGHRARITYPDANYFTYGYDNLGRITLVRENGVNWLNGFSYTNGGQMVAQSYNAALAGSSSYGYDGLGRINSLSHDLAGTGADVSFSFGRNAASQVNSMTRSNDSYAWTGHYDVSRTYTNNGLNQHTTAGPASFTYDNNGNLTSDGTRTYNYDSENRLVGASGGVQLGYDPLGRLAWTTGSPNFTQFLYDGNVRVAEYDYSGNLVRRHIPQPGSDTPSVTYEGSTVASPHFLDEDQQGSIVAITDSSGNPLNVDSYDEHGIPSMTNGGQFQYTGQAWQPELGMYYYRARMYSPTLGRFMQSDSVGYDAGMNLYNYVRGDPINLDDPTGMDDQVIEIDGHPNACASADCYFLLFVLASMNLQDMLQVAQINVARGPWGLPIQPGCPVNAGMLDNYLRRQNSPLAGIGQTLMDEGQRWDVDPRLGVALAGAETSFGQNITWGANNAWNWGWNHPRSNSPFDSYASGVRSVFHHIIDTNNYDMTNTTTLYSEGGRGAYHYCSNSEGNCQTGLNNINRIIRELGGDPNRLHFPCRRP